MDDSSAERLELTPEELEDTVQYSQQLVQQLLEIIGETLGEVGQLRREAYALRAALAQHGIDPPLVAALGPTTLEVEAALATRGDTDMPPAVMSPTTAAAQPPVLAGQPPAEEPPPPSVDQPQPTPLMADELVAVKAEEGPAARPSAASTAPVARPAPPVGFPPSSGQGILLVDDSHILQARLRSIIEPLGYQVVGAADNGEDGVQQAIALQPRCVVLDYHMPGMDGFETTLALQAQLPEARILICAADLTPEQSLELEAAGVCEIINKPVQLDSFIRALRNCMAE